MDSLSKVAVSPSSKNTDEGNKCSRTLSDSLLGDDSKIWREKVPVGIRFKPTDQVLVCHYLAGKVSGRTDGPIFGLIKEVDVYQYDPSQFPSLAYDFGDGKMYFFASLSRKTNTDRHVPGGFWKKVAKPSYVEDKDGKPVATKKTLVFYKLDNKSNPVKTHWLMEEYMLLDSPSPNQKDEEYPTYAPWTICVAYYCLKRRVMVKKQAAMRKNNLSSELCRKATSDRNSLVSENKQNSDDSVKRTCENDGTCRSIVLFQSLSKSMRRRDPAAA